MNVDVCNFIHSILMNWSNGAAVWTGLPPRLFITK